MKYHPILLMVTVALFSGCIGDDVIMDSVPEDLRIMNPIDTLGINDSYQFEATYFNNVGQEEMRSISWESSDETVVGIDATGLATGTSIGNAIIFAMVALDGGSTLSAPLDLVVAEETIVTPTTERTGILQTTSSYTLQGAFVLRKVADGLELELKEDYQASSSLPGLYVYLTNNPSTTSGAYEIGPATSFSGAHTYQIPNTVGLNDYSHVLYFCKPFNVKVGDGVFEN